MSRKALKRAAAVCIVSIVLSFVLGRVHVGGVFALFDGRTTNTGSALASGWVAAPTGLGTPSPNGYGASLSWTPGTHGPVTGQELWSADGGTAASAACGAYSLTQTMASASTSAYTDPGASGNNGHWWCYRMVSVSATAWTAYASFTPLKVGLVPTSVVLANGGAAGTLDGGDTITITFNQAVASAGGTTVCAFGGGPILLGDGTCSNSSTDGYTIGKLSGPTVGGSGGQPVGNTVSVAGSTVTITITATGPTVSGTASYLASASVTSSAGPATACTLASCAVTTSGSF